MSRSSSRRRRIDLRAREVERRDTFHRLEGELLSLVSLLGAPIVDPEGRKVGRVVDLVMRWTADDDYPPITKVVTRVGQAPVAVDITTVDVSQSVVRLRTSSLVVDKAEPRPEHVALAHDVLDHQLVDVGDIQVVRASDVSLVRDGDGLRVGGVDVSVRAYLRRVLPGRHRFHPPGRIIDWTQLQAFAVHPASSGAAERADRDRTSGAGVVGGALRLGVRATDLHTMSSSEIADVLTQLGRDSSTQLVSLSEPMTAAAALSSLRPDAREALLDQLDESSRTRLNALLPEADDR
jgi:hypothetical protein